MANEQSRDTLERRRARDAYLFLKERGDLKTVSRRAQGLPIAVRSQGLTVTVATLIKEDRKESRDLADLLARWLFEGSGVMAAQPERVTARSLLVYAIDCLRPDYLVLQAEALAYLEHVKRLASALEKAS